MANYFVAASGSNTSPYDTWAKAATSLQTALTAASTAGDRVILQYDGVPSGDAEVSVLTTYTFVNHVALICSTNSGTATITPTQMGADYWVGSSGSGSYGIQLAGAYRIYIYGLTIRSNGSSVASIQIGATDGSHVCAESCYFWINGGGVTSLITLGAGLNSANAYVNLKKCTFRFGHVSHKIGIRSFCEMESCIVSSSGVAISNLFWIGNGTSDAGGALLVATACDFSFMAASNSLFASASTIASQAYLSNCLLPSSYVVLASQTPANKGSQTVFLNNCGSGDIHYNFEHHDALGSTVIDTGIYANDGAQYDGTNYCSWKIVTTANCSYYTPYVSPWIDCYHSGTSVIAPSLEIVRSGSATAYQDDEVWGEFSYQGTSGSPLGIIVNDRMALAGTAADQTTGALDASGWTGESGTAWFGKLSPTASITPAEIGHLRARVCVGEPSVTVHVDPTIRGRS